MRIQKLAKFLLITIGILLTTQSGFAGESGTYKAISIQSYDYTNFDHFGQKIVGGPLKGVVAVLESSSAPFFGGDYSAVQCMALAKSSDQGVHLESPCTVTDKSGDKYYALAVRKTGDVETRSSAEGDLELLGGTGKYAGVHGFCGYTSEYLPNGFSVSQMTCDWNR